MAQVTDYTVSNQTFPNTRADLNNIFAAIATNNSGTTAPSNQQAGQWWIDTTSSTWILYIHDGTDDIQFATIDTSANTVNFTDSALDVVTDTTPQLGGNLDLNSNDITGTGNINITGNATVSGDLTVDTNTLYVDSANNEVGIGTTSPSDKLNVYDGAISVDSTSGIFNGTRYQAGSGSANINLYKSRTNTIGDHSALVNEDNISAIISRGSDGTSFIPTTAIFSKVDGSVSTNSIPSALIFSTNGGSSSYTERMRITSSGNVGIGTSSPSKELHVYASSGESAIQVETAGTDAGLNLIAERASASFINFGDQDSTNVGQIYYPHSGNYMHFKTNGAERMRIDSSGNINIGQTTGDFNTAGHRLRENGEATHTRSSAPCISVNRLTDDGTLVQFFQGGNLEGTISVSGSTVSYNGFTGTHWSRLSDNSKPTILKGTILESLDEMMDWYQVQFDVTKTDNEGNETIITKKESYALGDGQSVGDVITYNYEGIVIEKYIEKFGLKDGICRFTETFNLVYMLRTPEEVLKYTGSSLPELVLYNSNSVINEG